LVIFCCIWILAKKKINGHILKVARYNLKMNYDTALDDKNVKYFKLLKDKLLFLFLFKKV